jgi:hypothetical protein
MTTSNNFAVIYSFKISKEKEIEFIRIRSELTKLIYEFEGSYGSRLHKVDDHLFIAYAQWPDRETWKGSGSKLPEIAAKYNAQLRECCSEIKAEYELKIIEDLLQSDTF